MKFEKPIRILLLALPILILVLCCVPGMVSYSGLEKLEGAWFVIILGLPEGTVATVTLVTMIFTVFALAMAIGYWNSPSRTTPRLYAIFTTVNLLFTIAPLGVDEHLNVFPYIVFPVLLAAMLALSVYVSIYENKVYYDHMLE